MAEEDPLKDWNKTTLWFKAGIKSPMPTEVDVWYPAGSSDKERVRLLQNHASQSARLIRELTGTKEMIIQGQYADES
jgi:hypothetical protein